MTRAERNQQFLLEEQKRIESLKGKVIHKEDKNWFRTTHTWKDFRETFKYVGEKVFKNGKKKPIKAKDPFTGNDLVKAFQLHHMDLNPEHYTDLIPEHFLACNPNTHDIIHDLYTQYCKDQSSLDRLFDIVKKMYEINQGKDVKNFL